MMTNYGQRFPIYVKTMNTLFTRLTRKSSKVRKLIIIKRNFQPCYITASALQEVDSVEILLLLCKMVDETLMNKRNFVKTSQLSAVAARVSIASNGSDKRRKFKPKSKPTTSPPSKSASSCWNCGGPNHIFNHCTLLNAD